jgi:putative ABC transport system permease protein
MSNWLRYFAFWRRDPRHDARDEIGFHLDMRIRDLVERGLTREAAERRARSEFGDAVSVEQQLQRIDTRMIRRETRAAWWDDLRRDVHFGLRSLRKSPAFTITAVLCAALGIGTTATIVSAAHSILVRPLPYPDAERLVSIYGENTVRGYQGSNISYLDFVSWRDGNGSFEGIGIWTWSSLTLSDSRSDAERVAGAEISWNLFQTLGVQPARGRLFLPGEDGRAPARIVLLSDVLWRRRYGADTAIVGKAITVDGSPYTVVGIMPAGFRFPDRGEMWVPFTVTPNAETRGNRFHAGAIGRMKPGVTLEQARADLHRIDAELQREFVDANHGWRAEVIAMREDLVGDLRAPLRVFLWSVALVLVMVCANLANLMLARGAVRSREIAVRLALGASRRRLARQLMTESLLIAGIGGLLGVLVAWWGIRLLRFAFPDATPPFFITLSLDGATLLIILAVAVVTGLLFGALPSIRGTKSDFGSALRDGTRGAGEGLSRSRLRSGLVVSEIALSVMLMIGALLLVRSYKNLEGTDLGFTEKGVLSARISLPDTEYPTRAHSLAFFDRLVERLRAAPGVTQVAAAQGIPFSGWNVQAQAAIEGAPKARRGEELVAHYQLVTPEFFKTIGVPLLRGRWLSSTDRDSTAPVALVNQEFAKRAFGESDPLGKRIQVGGGEYSTIVGVVANYRHYRLPQPMGPAVYFTLATWPPRTQTVVLRTDLADPSTLVPTLRAALKELDPSVAMFQVQTFEEVVDRSLWRQRLQGNVLGIFAAMALLLACIGLYGVISYAVAQRIRELAVRMALGATRRDLLLLVFRQSGTLVGAGVVLGLAGALFGVRILESLLYGVDATDPLTFASVPLLLTLVGLIAALMPARRASAVDPIIAMRAE